MTKDSSWNYHKNYKDRTWEEHAPVVFMVKFKFSQKATKIDKIFTVDLTVTTYCQIVGEDFFSILVAFSENVNFNSMNNLLSYCGLIVTKIRASDKDLPVPNTK